MIKSYNYRERLSFHWPPNLNLDAQMAIIELLHAQIEARSWYTPIALALCIPYLFPCLYTVSDRHLTVALRNIAHSLRLPADLAGMTLLAFGNGAPDFFTAIFAPSAIILETILSNNKR